MPFRAYLPDQDFLLPPSLREWLPEDHLAYFVSDVVDQLDLAAIYAKYGEEERGQPPYHPRMMTKLLVYAARIEQQKLAYRSALLGLGVPGGDLADAADRVAEALSRALADKRGRWLLGGDHVSAACEYSLTGVDGGEVVNVRIDRTFIDTDGTRWIIDYKSSSHEGAGLETFLDNERERYRGQLERYRRMLSAFEALPVRMGLYFPLLNGWREVEDTSCGVESGNSVA